MASFARVSAQLLASILLACAFGVAQAQVETIRTTLPAQAAERQPLGSRYREAVDRALEATRANRLRDAIALLAPAIEYCDSLGATGRAQVSVTDATEYQAYMATRTDPTPVDWVDMACPRAYNARAYIAVEAKDTALALEFLSKAIALAPLWAEPPIERGYLLNQLQQSGDALASYRRALQLANDYPSNAYVKALALRGIGYAQVELGDLEAAERAYLESLEVEPDNALAKRELVYIRSQRNTGKP